MAMVTVAHFINPFLEVTQNWIYGQLVANTQCRHLVLCRTRINERDFPFDIVWARFNHGSPGAVIGRCLTWVMGRYPRSWYRAILAGKKPDIFHGHFAWESWRNLRLVKQTGLPLVTTFYGMDVDKLPRKRIWRKRYVELFRQGEIFIVEGPFMARRLERLGCPADKVRIVHIGVDTRALAPAGQSRSVEEVRIIFTGLGREKKGAAYAAGAFARAYAGCPHIAMDIVGDGIYADTMRKVFSSAGCLDKCVFHGRLDVGAYRRVLGRADICMAPSVTAADGDTEGGAPVTAIEAAARGIPVAGSRHCDIPEVVKDEETGILCDERDVDALASAIIRLSRDKALRERLGANARRHAEAHFDVRRQADRMADIYRGVMASLNKREKP